MGSCQKKFCYYTDFPAAARLVEIQRTSALIFCILTPGALPLPCVCPACKYVYGDRRKRGES